MAKSEISNIQELEGLHSLPGVVGLVFQDKDDTVHDHEVVCTKTCQMPPRPPQVCLLQSNHSHLPGATLGCLFHLEAPTIPTTFVAFRYHHQHRTKTRLRLTYLCHCKKAHFASLGLSLGPKSPNVNRSIYGSLSEPQSVSTVCSIT